ncbi:uncharacterized protein DSM5745_08488 [Aspergillus mulundensis]|uniref:Uncharacterized protein n=1 Tax=Aspergillus mulundensis TaxID=1810919 RepID=A0A3D8R441_9EURO|nr:hypothetical protein DSM5745_08488 [Aspergillus mulundensis]RDW68728.1 hypothetical protein DSM5745_08488 [Aspergillus mulundensis]
MESDKVHPMVEDTSLDPSRIATDKHSISHNVEMVAKPAKVENNAWSRIGLVSLLTLVLGFILVLVPLVLLGLMWKESMVAMSGGEPRELWFQVVHANWTSRLVTVCTAVIRTMIAMQATVATAMIGSVVLERIGVPLSHAPFYSIARAAYISPNSLLFTTGLRPKNFSAILVLLLIVLEVLLTFASQFLSTILISDFRTGVYTDTTGTSDVHILRNIYLTGVPPDWTSIPPASSWTFAERSESFTIGSDYHDTGHVYRAMLPFEDETQRTDLRSFNGPAPVMDQRMVCVSPTLSGLSLNSSFSTTDIRLSGQMTVDIDDYPMLRSPDQVSSIDFTCALPYLTVNSTESNTTTWESTLCTPALNLNWNVQLEDPLVEPTFNDSTAQTLTILYTHNPRASSMLLILDILDKDAIASSILDTDSDSGDNTNTTTLRTDGPWSIIGANGSEVLRVSACYTNLISKTFNLSMKRSWAGTEPKLTWDRNAQIYDTASSAHQLGASRAPDNLVNRGLLALSPPSSWEEYTIDYGPVDPNYEGFNTHWWFAKYLLAYLSNPQPDTTPAADPGVLLSSSNTGQLSPNADFAHVSLFQNTLRETGSPALATQALLARGAEMLYYNHLFKLYATEPAETAFAGTALVPARWVGFAVGVGIVGVHFVVLGVVVLLFLRWTRESVLGQYWQAVAHVVEGDTAAVIERVSANNATDGEVKGWRKDREGAGGVGLGLGEQSILRRRGEGSVAIVSGAPR